MTTIDTRSPDIGYDMPIDSGATSPEALKSAVRDKLEEMNAPAALSAMVMSLVDKLLAGDMGENGTSPSGGEGSPGGGGIPPGIEEADSPEELLAALMETFGVDPSLLEGLDPLDESTSGGNGSGGGSSGTTGNLRGSGQSGDVLENDVVDKFLIDGGFLSANNQGTANIVSSSNVDTDIGSGFSSSTSTSQSNDDTVM